MAVTVIQERLPTVEQPPSVSTRPRPRRSGDGRLALAYLAPGMTGFVVFIVVPLLASIVISLFAWPLFGTPEFVGLDNYRSMLTTDPVFWTILRNTAVFTVAYTVLNLVLATALAAWLHTLGRWAGFFRILFFVPVVVPMVANALVWRLMLDDSGLVNSFLAMFGVEGPSWLGDPTLAMTSLITMSIWQGIGYNIVVLGAGLNNISPSVLEAATVDGATGWTRFTKVVFPLLSPSIFFCTIMTIINAFKVFTQPYMLTAGGPGDATNTLVLYLYRQGFSYDSLGYASALAWVLFVFVMLITALQFAGQKRWVSYDS
jgi:multiple sugar transport system permease protein